MELKEIFASAWKRKWTLLAVVVAAVAAAAAFAYSRPPQFESTATIALTPNVQKGQGFVASDNLSTLLSTYAATAKSSVNQRAAEQILGRPLGATISTSTSAGTGILKISARSTDPQAAMASADAVTEAFRRSFLDNQLLVAQVVDPAQLPTAPVQPRPPLIIAAGLFLGLLGGVALVIALERWFARIETAEEAADVSGLPVLGHIPRHRALRRRSLVWDDPELVEMQEAVRALRTTLEFSVDFGHAVLQVTSAGPGEGKSTIAANLAVALAGVGVPTLLVDADLRRPRQHEIFDVPNDRGLSTLMAIHGSHVTPVATEYENLSLIPSGPPPPSPTEMIHVRFESALRHLRNLRSVLILDTPPVLAVSDARLIASRADRVIVVASAGETKPAALRQTVERLELAKADVAGVVLNRVSADREAGAYDRYYHFADPQVAEQR